MLDYRFCMEKYKLMNGLFRKALKNGQNTFLVKNNIQSLYLI